MGRRQGINIPAQASVPIAPRIWRDARAILPRQSRGVCAERGETAGVPVRRSATWVTWPRVPGPFVLQRDEKQSSFSASSRNISPVPDLPLLTVSPSVMGTSPMDQVHDFRRNNGPSTSERHWLTLVERGFRPVDDGLSKIATRPHHIRCKPTLP
jgi:hypothetical protein